MNTSYCSFQSALKFVCGVYIFRIYKYILQGGCVACGSIFHDLIHV